MNLSNMEGFFIIYLFVLIFQLPVHRPRLVLCNLLFYLCLARFLLICDNIQHDWYKNNQHLS